MEYTPSDFRSYFGTLFLDETVYTDCQIQSVLDEAGLEVARTIFKGYYMKALFYLSAHFLIVNKQIFDKAEFGEGTAFASPTGVVNSVSVGDLSLSKEMPTYEKSSDDKFLASTIFGQEFIRIRNKMSRGALLSCKPGRI